LPKQFSRRWSQSVGAHVKVNKFEQEAGLGEITIIAAGGFGFQIIAA
jgi:hypothetical protein